MRILSYLFPRAAGFNCSGTTASSPDLRFSPGLASSLAKGRWPSGGVAATVTHGLSGSQALVLVPMTSSSDDRDNLAGTSQANGGNSAVLPGAAGRAWPSGQVSRTAARKNRIYALG